MTKYDITGLEIDNDGFISARVTDGENYLSYFYTPIEGWGAIYGKVNNRHFKRGHNRATWKTDGRGRASELTLDKVYEMQKYFFKNVPDVFKIREMVKER